MLSLQISTPPLKVGFYSSLFKPAFLLGVAGVSSVGLASTLTSDNNSAKSMVNDIIKKAGEQESIQQLGKGISELFDTLGGWSKIAVNTASEWKDKLKNYVKIDQIPEGSKTIFSNLSSWATQAWEAIKKHLPEITKVKWETIRSFIAQHGDKALNFLAMLKNILNSKGGDTLLITKLLEALGKSNFGDFASAMSGLIQKKPEAFNGLNGDDVGKMLDAFNADEKGTVETLKKFGEQPEELNKDKLVGAFNRGSLMWRAQHYLNRAKEFEAQKRTGKQIDQRELKNVIEKLQAVMKEIEEIKQKHTQAK